MTKEALGGWFAIIVAVAVALYVANANYSRNTPVSSEEDSAIRSMLIEFGKTLQNVSLLAPDASAQMASQYSTYVAPQLLAQWQSNPQSAIGRQTSSPWPESIDVVEVKINGTYATAEANVIEITSENPREPAAVYPISMTLEKRGTWVITTLTKGAYSELPQRIEVSGIWECLPHKDKTGPQTEECALGIAIDQSDGHYAIDTRLMAMQPVDFATGTHVRVSGVLTPVEMLSSIQKYDIDGVISATTIQEIK